MDRARGYDKAKFYDIPMEGFRPFSGKLLLVNVGQVKHQYIATLFYKNSEKQTTVYTNQNTAVDVNVGHFNFTKGVINILPKSVNKLYDQDKYYQNRLARKREVHPKLFKKSKSYQKVRIKLQRNYRRITNIQNDILHKFTHYLIVHFDRIVIENLDVRQMQMTHVASKGMQRSLFGRFRQFLAYKCKWYGKKLILASRWYPSTQICSRCGYRKVGNDKITLQGNQKHHTRHDQFICYHCGFRSDRDDNAVGNLLKLAD